MTPHPPIVHAILRAVLEAADPARAVDRSLQATPIPAGPVALLALGKAATGMAAAAIERLGPRIVGGVVVGVPEHIARFDPAGLPIRALPADHPLPTARNVTAAEVLLAEAGAVGPDTTALVLISGGGSAQLTLPAGDLTLEDIRAVTNALLRAGASIDELNAVRKHLDRLKGGQLARALSGAGRVEALVLSDVLGDRLDVISSGPTAPDPTTYAQAIEVLTRRGVTPPDRVLTHLQAGAHGRVPETPKPGDPACERVRHRVIANNAAAVAAAADALRGQGWSVQTRTGVTGEAAEAGRALARDLAQGPPRSIVWGGETTVRVGDAPGVGGRNQELALAAAVALEGQDGVLVMSLGTDGVDGPTDAAGAVVTGQTAGAMRRAGVDPARALARHDAHPALDAAGALLRTGPTGTNVNDITVGLRLGPGGGVG